MRVILREDVTNLGRVGDEVEVAEGYFRNYLSPRGLALQASKRSRKLFEQEKKRLLLHAEREQEKAARIAEELKERIIKFKLKAGEDERLFGSVTSADVAEALTALGYEVEKRRVQLSEHIKTLGMYTVHIRLHPEVIASVRVLVERE